MFFWVFLLLTVLLVTIADLIYLVTRFAHFGWVRFVSRGNKWVRYGIGLLEVALIGGAGWYLMGFLNTAVVLIHLGIFWLICDAIAFLITGLRAGARSAKEFFHRHGFYDHYIAVDHRPGFYTAGLIAIVLCTVYMGIAAFQTYHVFVKHYEIATEKNVGDLRIVQFADSHLGTTFDADGFAKWAKKMEKEKPDIVVLTGDFVDDGSTREDMEACAKILGEMKTTYGVYYAFGNHDKGYGNRAKRGFSGEDVIRELEKNGVVVLQDQTADIDGRFAVIGRQDKSEEMRKSQRAAMSELAKDLDPMQFSVVLDHQPNDYAAEEAAGVDLVLSGHTHGGQFFPVNRLGEWIKVNDKSYGYEKRGNTNFIVTSGISDWELIFKTGCRSEFVVIDIKGEKNET